MANDFLDYVKIYVKAGKGGDGAVSFRHEKYVPNAGPDGGDGGKGGDIIFKVDPSLNTLVPFRYQKKYFAEDGQKGQANNCTGRSGKDLIIKVPVGTVIRDTNTNSVVADIYDENEEVVLLKGGRGGKGNARFAHSKRQAPTFSQLGETTEEHQITLELCTIADVGLVGYPNVGKSTLLSVLTSARPKIANYHFTTINPNLGVVELMTGNFVIADIPGLIEGASEGAGLGHYFLRHIERVRIIVHLVDISGSEGRDPIKDYFAINEELKKHSEKLAQKPQIVVCSKADLLEDRKVIKDFEKAIGQKVFVISSYTHEGLEPLLEEIKKQVELLPPPERVEIDKEFVLETKKDQNYEIEITEDGNFLVTGGLVDFLIQNVVVSSTESFAFMQNVLKDRGVIQDLLDMGLQEGDIVESGDIEFEWVE